MLKIVNPDLRIIKPGHEGNLFHEGKFLNYQKVKAPTLKDILRWKLNGNPQKHEKQNDAFTLETYEDEQIFNRDLAKIVWLGHASFLLTINGRNILLDPVFADIPLVRRRSPVPFEFECYNQIDYILISHAHYDHLDKKTISRLARLNPEMKIYCGLGTAKLLQKWKISNPITEAGWYQQFPLFADCLSIYFMPSLHWSNRNLTDRNTRLWGSFVVKGDAGCIYFMGDSGYSPHFKEIGSFFPEIDYALLGIGAYMPRNIMQYSHINPEEARQAYFDLGAKVLVPMHYATYDLTDEPYSEPLWRLRELFVNEEFKLCVSNIGEIIKI